MQQDTAHALTGDAPDVRALTTLRRQFVGHGAWVYVGLSGDK